MVNEQNLFENIIPEFIENILEKPEIFIKEDDKNQNIKEKIIQIIKLLFDYSIIFLKKNFKMCFTIIKFYLGKKIESQKKNMGSILKELFIDGLDYEQIWEQIQLQNKPLLKYIFYFFLKQLIFKDI